MSRINILVTGASGLLGRYLLKSQRKHSLFLAKHSAPISGVLGFKEIKLDITKKVELEKVFSENSFDACIHAASIGNVDECEKNRELAFRTNAEATENLAKLCEEHATKMVYTSTNAVFDGRKNIYSELDTPKPLNYYGKTKLLGEKAVENASSENAVLRLNTMYGWNNEGERGNPATWCIQMLRQKKQIKVVDDIYNNHLYAGSAAEAVWKCIELKESGLFHVAGAECVDRYSFSVKVAEVFGLDSKLIFPVKNSFFKEIAPRPMKTCYSTEKMEKALKFKPLSLLNGLSLMKEEEQLLH